MAGALKLKLAPLSQAPKGVLMVFCDDALKLGAAARRALTDAGDLVARAAAAERFKGKNGSCLDIVAPAGLAASRLIVIGTGKAADLKPQDFVKLGGTALGKLPSSAREATIIDELPNGAIKPDAAADIALGARLRAYSFERYKTKRKEGEEAPADRAVTLAVGDVAAVNKALELSTARE